MAPPAWPHPPEGWVPPPGWQPDPSWGPAPAGWQFWVRDSDDDDSGPVLTVPTGPVVGPPTEISGEDGLIALVGDHLVLTYTDKFTTNALKKAIGVRAYPLAAVDDIQISPDGHRGHPTLRVLVHPGADLLRPLLKDPRPGPGGDPDTLILRKGGTVAQAAAFAVAVHAQARTAARPPQSTPVFVDSGRLPMTVAGANTTATFDGSSVLLQVSSRTASAAKKNTFPRHIPAEAIIDVVIHHPTMTGALRFLLAGGPGRDATTNPKTDPDTIELHADNSQSYAVFAAAVLTAGRRTGSTVHPELLSRRTPPPLLMPPGPTPSVAPTPRPRTAAVVTPAAGAVTPSPQVHTSPDPRSPLPAPLQNGPVPALSADPVAGYATANTGAAETAPAVKAGWRERRADKREARQHEEAVAVWEVDQARLETLARVAQAATGSGGGLASGIMLRTGEAALWTGPASLVEPRRQQGHYAGAYSGVSFRVAKGVRYTVGGTRGHYVPGPELQTPIDNGRAVITTGRVVFTGGKATREWTFSKLVSMDSSADDSTVLISVSNRQKVSGVHLGKTGTEFTHFLALGVAISQNGAPAVAAECQQSADAHRGTRP